MELLTRLSAACAGQDSLALGMVVESRGSTPQKMGSRAILDATGKALGTLGGGLVEARGLDAMRRALESGDSELLEISLDEPYSREAGPICGGIMKILVTPHTAANAAAYGKALRALMDRHPGILATCIGAPDSDGLGVAYWIGEDQSDANVNGLKPEDARACLIGERAKVAEHEGFTYFLEPILAPPRLLVVGGGHVGQAVALQGNLLGFEVTVYDDRPEYAEPSLFPEGTRCGHGSLKALVEEFPKDKDTYIVLVSKGHRPDAEALESCIHSDVAYLGMIGSKRKVASLKEHFLAESLCSPEEWSRLVTPIGYDIGAVTVHEIGVSIAAQLVAARRKPQSIREPGIKAVSE